MPTPPPAAGNQHIPRPPRWALGAPPVWEAEDHHRIPMTIAAVLEGLGAVHQLGAAPADLVDQARRTNPVLDAIGDLASTSRAAVLCLLFADTEDGPARVVLTRRSARLRQHRGEVAFPGGRLDAGEDAEAAALREAAEEVGLDPRSVEVVGWLQPLVTLASGSSIEPLVAISTTRPVLVPNEGEVDRIFDVALDELLAPGVFHEERWWRPDRPTVAADGSFPLFFFDLEGETIWGATGRMLVELIARTQQLPPPIG